MRTVIHSRLARPVSIGVIIAALMVAALAAAPAAPAQPNKPIIGVSSNAGEIEVRWHAAAGARFYTVGWVNKDEFEEMRAAGRDWLDAFHFTTIPATYTSHRVSGLKASSDYYAIVGARTTRFGGEPPVWSPWSGLARTSGQHGAGFCPVTGLPLPPGGYLSVGDSTTHAGGQTFTLNSVTKKAAIRLGDTSYRPFTGRQYVRVCGTVQTTPNLAGFFRSGSDYHVDTDAGLGFAALDDDVTDWRDGGIIIPKGQRRSACEVWDLSVNASNIVIAINNWRANPDLYLVTLP